MNIKTSSPLMQATDDPVSVAGLIERGWSRAMVDSILGKADETRRNPHYRSGPPMRLYDLE